MTVFFFCYFQFFDPSADIANVYVATRTAENDVYTLTGTDTEIQLGDDDVLLALETSRPEGWIGFGKLAKILYINIRYLFL